jgi:hypothetical protein
MQIEKSAAPRRSVVSLIQIEKDRHDVFASHKRFADERFQPQHLISCAALLTEATLYFSQGVVAFKKSDESLVDHTFKRLAQTAGQRCRPVVTGVGRVLARLWYWNYCGFTPARRGVPRLPFTYATTT